MELSVIIPVFNEEENVGPLYNQLKPVLEGLKKEFEIIFIDDGSTDSTFRLLERIQQGDKKVKVIKLRKNFGQTSAISAGFNNAKGDIIVTMDGDLQNDPRDIPLLLEKLGEGYDVVSGWRHDRKDPFLTKVLPSKISNWLAQKFSRLEIHDFGCTLKAYTKDSIKGIQIYGESHRYLPVLVAMNGFKVSEIKVRHSKREKGKSKYGMQRLLKGFLDLLYMKFWYDYSTRPLHFFGLLGAIQLFLGSLIASYKVIIKLLLFGEPLEVGPMLLLSVLLVVLGLQFITLGFLGEIQIRTYYNLVANNKVEKILS